MKQTSSILMAVVAGVALLAVPRAPAATQWWDASSAAGLQAGTGIWSTVDAMWATNSSPVAGNGPFAWVDGNDAVFSVVATATVNSVTANSISPWAGNPGVFLFPGTGPLTIGAGGIALDHRFLHIFSPIVLSADQTWSINSTAGQRFEGAISGPGRLTVRTGAGNYNGKFTLTNVNSRFNGFTTYGTGGQVESYTPEHLSIMAGTITNGLTLGVPGGSATNGAKLTIIGTGSTMSDVGDVTVASPAILTLNSTASTNILAGGALTRIGHATLELALPNGLGTREKVTFTSGVTPNNNILPPWMINTTAPSVLNYAGELINAANVVGFGANTATQFVRLTSATVLSGNAAAQAFYMNNNTLNLNGNTLALGDGTYAGVIARNTITNTSASGSLDFGTAEALIYVGNGQVSTFACNLSGTNGLTKFGGGTLTLISDMPYMGPIWLNNGTLTLSHSMDAVYTNNILGTGSLVKDGASRLTLTGTNVLNSVTLNVSGASLALVDGASLRVSGGLKYIGNAMSNNVVVISGSNTFWDNWNNIVSVGHNSPVARNNSLVVANGAVVTNTVSLNVGASGGASGNKAYLTNEATYFANNANGGGFYSGAGNGCNSNSIYVGSGSLLYGGGANSSFNIGAASATGNLFTVDGGRVIVVNTGYRCGVGGGYNPTGVSVDNLLAVSNGGYLITPYDFCIGGMNGAASAAIGNRALVTGTNSLWVINSPFEIGLANGSSWAIDNGLLIDGGTVTNTGANVMIGQNAGAIGNWMVLTNGGRFFYTGAVDGRIGYAADSNYVAVAGSPAGASLWHHGNRALFVGHGAARGNALNVDGGIVTGIGTLTLGTISTSIDNSMTIANGGSVSAATVLNGGSTTGSFSPSNSVRVTSGGVLEANTLSDGPATGNSIVNNGGVYQFTSVTPTISPNGNPITINNGSISFRALTTANVKGNWGGSQLTNLTWSGANAFRLNIASNTTASSQTYVFDPGLGTTNYARLEMFNGSTCYRGAAGNTLTIGQSVGSGGAMLCSNTAAVVSLVFTNNGTVTLVNSTLTLTTNAVMNGTLVIDSDRLVSTNGVLFASNLTLGPASTLQVTGKGTNAVLFATTGTFASVIKPDNYVIRYTGGLVRMMTAPPRGTALILR